MIFDGLTLARFEEEEENAQISKVDNKRNLFHVQPRSWHVGHSIVKNTADGKSFWVCKNCKIEIEGD